MRGAARPGAALTALSRLLQEDAAAIAEFAGAPRGGMWGVVEAATDKLTKECLALALSVLSDCAEYGRFACSWALYISFTLHARTRTRTTHTETHTH